MVARITSGATPAGALYYNKDKIDRGEGRFLAAFNTPMQVTDERYFDIREALRCFEPYLEANRRTKNPVFHASLNPAPEDRLTNDDLRQIAREYMERMGYGAQPCFVFSARGHRTPAYPYRVAARGARRPQAGARLRGAAVAGDPRCSGTTLRTAPLPPRATRSRRTTRCRNSTIRKATSNDNSASLVRSTLHRYRCASFGELRTLLEYFNVSIEECRGTAHGHEYAGILYGALDDDAMPQGVPIKSSRIGRDVGHRALGRYYARSRGDTAGQCGARRYASDRRAGAGCCPFPGGVLPSVGSGRDHGRAAPHRRRTYLRYDVHRSPCGCRGQRFAPGTGVRGKRSGGAFRRWPS